MNLNTYKEMTNKLDGFYSLTDEQQFLLFVWAQCLEYQSWNTTHDFTQPNYPDGDKVRILIKRNRKFFQEKFDINTASLEPTTKHLFAAAYFNAFSQGCSKGFHDCSTAK